MNVQENKYISKILYWLPSIIFNILETIIIFVLGSILGNSIYKILYIVIIFETTRHIIKKDKHYKNPFKCLLLTTFIFASIFLIAKNHILIYTGSSILAAFVLSGRADIPREKEENNKENDEENDNNKVGMYLWKQRGEPSKYKFIEEYVKANKETKQIKEFEDFLNRRNSEYYEIYKLRFYDGKSQKYIIEKMKITSTARLTEKLDEIQSILELYLEFNQRELVSKN